MPEEKEELKSRALSCDYTFVILFLAHTRMIILRTFSSHSERPLLLLCARHTCQNRARILRKLIAVEIAFRNNKEYLEHCRHKHLVKLKKMVAGMLFPSSGNKRYANDMSPTWRLSLGQYEEDKK